MTVSLISILRSTEPKLDINDIIEMLKKVFLLNVMFLHGNKCLHWPPLGKLLCLSKRLRVDKTLEQLGLKSLCTLKEEP